MMCIFVCVCTEPTREFDINIIAIIVYICIIYISSNRLFVPLRHIVLALESFLRDRFNRIELRMQARASELRNKYDD